MARMLAGLVEQIVAKYPQRLAFIEAQRNVDYGTFGRHVRCVTQFFSARITSGDRVALLLENSAEYAAACYGIWCAGGVVVGLNTALKARDISSLINHSGASWLIADGAHRELAAVCADSGIQVVLVGDNAEIAATAQWQQIVSADAPVPETASAIQPDALASIIYTSGTTGNPKGVALTHGNLAANMASIREYLPLQSDDRMLCVLPFYYSYGNSVLHTHLAVGATLILENSLMYPHKVLARMSELKATAFAGVPSTFYLLLSRAKLQDFDLSSLRYCTQAGGGMDKTRIAAWCDALPMAQFYVMYGQTEASARLTYLPPHKLAEKAASVGIAIPGVEISVRDERDQEVAVGTSGEICARGANVMQGYWRDDSETAAVLRGGWLHTGDVGYCDADGYFFLVGRNKEMIKTGAHRVSPREIEELIATVPGVQEVAVVGVADDVLGQVIKACVIAPGDHEELKKQILRLCREQLALYKLPRQVSFYEGFPRTASGKIQKHLID